jgi:polar amino acid transport system substrate-binding protein
MKIKFIVSVFAAIFLGLTIIGCAPKEHDDKFLVVGMELAYPPFEMIDQYGRPGGVSVDLAVALAKSMRKEVQIENIPFDGLIPALQSEKIDMIISSMTKTPERAQSIAFSDPYLKTGLCLLVGSNSPVQSITDADQPGRTIVVKQGTTGQSYAMAHVKKAKLSTLDKEDACVLEVVQGKADAFIYDQMSTFANWQRNKETTRAILKPFQEESWAVGLRLNDTNRVAQVNQFLKTYKDQGGFEQLGDRYLKEQKEAFRKMGLPFYF